jgi:hypothetical protein
LPRACSLIFADAVAADVARAGLNECQWRAEPLDDDGGADLIEPSGELEREGAQHFRAPGQRDSTRRRRDRQQDDGPLKGGSARLGALATPISNNAASKVTKEIIIARIRLTGQRGTRADVPLILLCSWRRGEGEVSTHKGESKPCRYHQRGYLPVTPGTLASGRVRIGCLISSFPAPQTLQTRWLNTSGACIRFGKSRLPASI